MKYKKDEFIGDDILDLDEGTKKNEKSLNAIKLSNEEYNYYRKTDDSVADDLLD
jgi:hypothetical protein